MDLNTVIAESVKDVSGLQKTVVALALQNSIQEAQQAVAEYVESALQTKYPTFEGGDLEAQIAVGREMVDKSQEALRQAYAARETTFAVLGSKKADVQDAVTCAVSYALQIELFREPLAAYLEQKFGVSEDIPPEEVILLIRQYIAEFGTKAKLTPEITALFTELLEKFYREEL